MGEPVLRPEVRRVSCAECSKHWRYGCPECAELFADYHRNEFDHTVTVVGRADDRFKDLFTGRPRRRTPWYET